MVPYGLTVLCECSITPLSQSKFPVYLAPRNNGLQAWEQKDKLCYVSWKGKGKTTRPRNPQYQYFESMSKGANVYKILFAWVQRFIIYSYGVKISNIVNTRDTTTSCLSHTSHLVLFTSIWFNQRERTQTEAKISAREIQTISSN